MSEPTSTDSSRTTTPPPPTEGSLPLLALRSATGGTLMGLANLVPGISGGTMLLASGVYPRFVQAIAEITTLKLRAASLLVLGTVITTAGLAILLLAGLVKGLVVDHRWIMYSLFIGLTLGGVPVVWRMVGRARPSLWVGAAVGLAVMVAIALLQRAGYDAAGDPGARNVGLLFAAGLVGAGAMILPGISGGYMLLVMGQYVPILSAIDEFKNALRGGDFAAALDPALWVLLPVGVGVILGVVAVSNLLKLLLTRFEQPTLGVLLGLLIGAVAGLWPFQQAMPPALGAVIKGRVVTEELLRTLESKDWPTVFFTPSTSQVAIALGMIGLGFLLTVGVAWLGRERESAR